MHQLINKQKIYFYLISFLFLSTIVNYHFINNIKNKFKIKIINVEIENSEIREIILSNTRFLLEKNIFFIDNKFLTEKLNNLNFIETINITKKYPSVISIKVKKTNLIAITYLDQKKYYIGMNGNFISAKQVSSKKKLPVIFGKFSIDDYLFLNREISKQKISESKIISYYFHKNKRWDLHFSNNILIQLPSKNIDGALKLYKSFVLKNIIAPNTIIDLRIKNRLTLRNG